MKARKKGTTEWKEYEEVFDQYGAFQGLETAGYTETPEEEFKRLGIPINPDDKIQASRLRQMQPHYVSAVLPLECFDIWSEKDEETERLAEALASNKAPIELYDEWKEYRRYAAVNILCSLIHDGRMRADASTVKSSIWLADELISQLQEEEKK